MRRVGGLVRFPRVVGFIRDDKSAEDATTTKEIAEMFAQQRRSFPGLEKR
jgi:DNA ligase-1